MPCRVLPKGCKQETLTLTYMARSRSPCDSVHRCRSAKASPSLSAILRFEKLEALPASKMSLPLSPLSPNPGGRCLSAPTSSYSTSGSGFNFPGGMRGSLGSCLIRRWVVGSLCRVVVAIEVVRGRIVVVVLLKSRTGIGKRLRCHQFSRLV